MSAEHDRLLELASNPSTPSAELRSLARSPYLDIRDEVARNPGCPTDALRWLLDKVPWRVLTNPALDLVLLQEPQFFSSCSPDTQIALARSRSLTPSVAAALAQLDAREVGLALARNRATPPQVLTRLCVCWHSSVRVAAARSRSTPRSTLSLLQRAGATPRLQAFRPCARLTERDLTRLLGLGGWAALLVASSPSCPPPLLRQLATHGQASSLAGCVRAAVANNPATDPATLRALAFRERGSHDRGTDVDDALARNLASPPDVLEALAESIHTSVQGWIALNPNAPEGALWRTAGSVEFGVRSMTRAHPRWPAALGEALDALGFPPSLADYPPDHRTASEGHLQRVADTGPWLWWYLLSHPSTPDAILKRLGARSWGTLNASLYRIASHPGTDPLRMRRLALFFSKNLRASLLHNPSLPPDLREVVKRS